MIKNKKLLIDNDCPMCRGYAKLFTKLNWIDEACILPYQNAKIDAQHLDMRKAKNKIALTGESQTTYGVNAIIEIVSQTSPKLKSILKNGLFYQPLCVLYNFISYNRRLIYPTATTHEQNCIPDIHLGYRWAYIIMTALFTGLILNIFSFKLFSSMSIAHTPYLEWLMCFGQILWQGIFVKCFLVSNKTMDYLGNMSTVSLIGGVLLTLFLWLTSLIEFTPLSMITSFGGIVSLMLIEHVRRCKCIGLPLVTTISWIAFRLIFLFTIIAMAI